MTCFLHSDRFGRSENNCFSIFFKSTSNCTFNIEQCTWMLSFLHSPEIFFYFRIDLQFSEYTKSANLGEGCRNNLWGGDVKVILEKTRHKYKTNLTKEESSGKRKALQDKNKVFLPADKGRIMVAMDRYESAGGEQSYEYKMKQVLIDLKARPSKTAKKDWHLTDKVCRDGMKVVDTIVWRGEISKEEAERLNNHLVRNKNLWYMRFRENSIKQCMLGRRRGCLK